MSEISNSSGSNGAVLQVGGEACQHCGPVEEELHRLAENYNFKLFYADAGDSDCDLVEHYNITHLPTLVVYTSSLESPVVVQSMRVAGVSELVHQHFTPKLILDEEF